jgi:hypothetical protein
MLLCSHHHKLLHEGGFKIRRDVAGDTYFQRPDGRVIPRHGYRLDDMCDDFAEPECDSAESWTASAAARIPPAEVREMRAAYQLRPRRCAEPAFPGMSASCSK